MQYFLKFPKLELLQSENLSLYFFCFFDSRVTTFPYQMVSCGLHDQAWSLYVPEMGNKGVFTSLLPSQTLNKSIAFSQV